MKSDKTYIPMSGMRLPHTQLVEMAVEALKRSNFVGIDDGMHPEDWAAALVPAIEAVAIGYGEGYRNGLRDGRATTSKPKDKGGPSECGCDLCSKDEKKASIRKDFWT